VAYVAYPIAKTKPPYGDIYHDHVPVIVTTVSEYEAAMGQKRHDFGCGACNDADPLVITVGRTQGGVWLEAEVLLDTLSCTDAELIRVFELDDAWFWNWEQDYHGDLPPDQAAIQPPHQVRT
jgi:hypothetical protein